jgi:hypothetical protein
MVAERRAMVDRVVEAQAGATKDITCLCSLSLWSAFALCFFIRPLHTAVVGKLIFSKFLSLLLSMHPYLTRV